MTKPLAIIAGVGPGVGAAVARRFAKEGYHVVLIARDAERLTEFVSGINTTGGVASSYSADLSDHEQVRTVFTSILENEGSPEVLVWNAAIWDEKPALDLDPLDFDRQMRLGLTAALTALNVVGDAMLARGRGSVLLTGGGLALAPQYGGAVPALTAVKSALRGFVYASAPGFAEKNLRLATVTIAGQVKSGSPFDPDRIASTFWTAHTAAEPLVEYVFDGK